MSFEVGMKIDGFNLSFEAGMKMDGFEFEIRSRNEKGPFSVRVRRELDASMMSDVRSVGVATAASRGS